MATIELLTVSVPVVLTPSPLMAEFAEIVELTIDVVA